MYGLPQSGILSNELLEKRLNAAGITKASWYPVYGLTSGGPFNLAW